MPTKPFYSMEEVCARLGKTQDQVKGLVRDGTLREFRDAGKVFFKAEDIERLAAPGAGPSSDTGEIMLEPVADTGSDTGSLPSLADSAGGTSIIGLEPLPEEEEQQKKKEKEDTVITKSGIGVFDDDELEIDADPMAKTQITTGATDDQVSLEGAGSGSGLLDLAREADDTALGAELLDEIWPGRRGSGTRGRETAGQAREASGPGGCRGGARNRRPPKRNRNPRWKPRKSERWSRPSSSWRATPAEGILSGLLVGGLVVMALAFTAAAAALQGFVPDFILKLGDGSTFFYFLGGAVLVPVLALGGWAGSWGRRWPRSGARRGGVRRSARDARPRW